MNLAGITRLHRVEAYYTTYLMLDTPQEIMNIYTNIYKATILA